MTPSARVQTAIDLLNAILESPQIPSDKIINRYFRDHRYIGSKDRRVIGALCYTALRLYPKYETVAQRNNQIDGRLLILLILRHEENQSIEDIEFLCGGGHYDPYPLDKQEIKALAASLDLTIAQTLCIPETLYPFFEKSMSPADLTALAEINETEATVDLRVNTLKASRDTVLTQLQCEGFDVAPTPHSSMGIRFEKRHNLEGHPLFQSGTVEVQDEGSQILSLICDAAPGMTVLDYCAGAGGKTLALAAMMKNKGQLYASDIHEWRLKRAKERARKADVHNVRFHVANDPKFLKRHAKFFDRVLVDAPCSGTGTWRRNPDLKIKTTDKDIHELCALQRDILNKTAPLVKVDGYLFYATCSVLTCENQEQIQWFLDAYPEFELAFDNTLYQNLRALSKNASAESIGLTLLPHHFNTDGFFICALRRRENPCPIPSSDS